jgi:hypothetical protein
MSWGVLAAFKWALIMFGIALILSLALAQEMGWIGGGRR